MRMLKIWSYTKTFPDKVNFIDSNNIILGYDLSQSCCENATWAIGPNKDGSDSIHSGSDEESEEFEMDGYRFDPDFSEVNEDSYEEPGGAYALFKLIHQAYGARKPPLYVRLENCHNGYYGHGFTFSGAPTLSGCL